MNCSIHACTGILFCSSYCFCPETVCTQLFLNSSRNRELPKCKETKASALQQKCPQTFSGIGHENELFLSAILLMSLMFYLSLPFTASFFLSSLSPSIYHSQSACTQQWLNTFGLSVVSSAVSLLAIKFSSLDTVNVFKVGVKVNVSGFNAPTGAGAPLGGNYTGRLSDTFSHQRIDPFSPAPLLPSPPSSLIFSL